MNEEAVKAQAATDQARARFQEVFEQTSRTGLIEVGETNLSITPLGAQCLDEMLMYLSEHPRADIAKRAAKLREAIHP